MQHSAFPLEAPFDSLIEQYLRSIWACRLWEKEKTPPLAWIKGEMQSWCKIQANPHMQKGMWNVRSILKWASFSRKSVEG